MGTFKIAAPFATVEEVRALKESGADELYCGYVDENSDRLWPTCFHLVNRRGKGMSFDSFATFKTAVNKAERRNLPVYVTMNGLYTPEQYPWLLKTIDKISGIRGMKGLIVADLGLLLTLKKIGYKKEIHISTGGTVFNHHSADFFHSLGAKRAILDRQLTAEEMADLIACRKSDIEIEIFTIHGPCVFIDGYCAFFHFTDAQRDRELYELNKRTYLTKSYCSELKNGFGSCLEIKEILQNKEFEVHSISKRKEKKYDFKYQKRLWPTGCNLCSLYKLNDFSGIVLKIVGRGSDQTETVKLLSALIKELSRPDITEEEHHKIAKRFFKKMYKKMCTPFDCYCPQDLVV